jgi:hypothetical protein
MNLALSEFPRLGQPIPPAFAEPPDSVARVYAMVTNIDTNVGRILKALEAKHLANDTIVVFLTDNGPAQVRFNAGLRGWKGSVYDGGIHVPCYIRWPGHFPAGHVVEQVAAHIDLMPTLLAACGVPTPRDPALDGRSLLLLLRGIQTTGWPDRTLFVQWHRGDRPELGRAFAARSRTYKLLRREPVPGTRGAPPLELYDMERDPLELRDVAARHPDVVKKLHAEYQAWFKDVTSRGFDPVRIELGGVRENPTMLTRQDWRGPRAGWDVNDIGFWEVVVVRAGTYDMTLHFAPRRFPTTIHVSLDGATVEHLVSARETEYTFKEIPLQAGPGRLEAWIEGNGGRAGILDVTVVYREPAADRRDDPRQRKRP